ncbi:DUF427 domain-containing protein [Streptosporangium sp. G12]
MGPGRRAGGGVPAGLRTARPDRGLARAQALRHRTRGGVGRARVGNVQRGARRALGPRDQGRRHRRRQPPPGAGPGVASSWSARRGGSVPADVAWAYPDPIPAAGRIRDHVAFHNEVVDIVVDGVKLEGPVTLFTGRPREG